MTAPAEVADLIIEQASGAGDFSAAAQAAVKLGIIAALLPVFSPEFQTDAKLAIDKMLRDLTWKGPNGRVGNYVVLDRAPAIALLTALGIPVPAQ